MQWSDSLRPLRCAEFHSRLIKGLPRNRNNRSQLFYRKTALNNIINYPRKQQWQSLLINLRIGSYHLTKKRLRRRFFLKNFGRFFSTAIFSENLWATHCEVTALLQINFFFLYFTYFVCTLASISFYFESYRDQDQRFSFSIATSTDDFTI